MVTSMTATIAQAVIFLLCLLSSNEVEGRQLSREEGMELEKQLKIMNKPAVKTIKTKSGDIYNCVDFYQQPAFDHPLLKNHAFEFKARPSFFAKESTYKDRSTIPSISPKESTYIDHSFIFNPSSIWLNGKGCPNGTVPIKKTTKDDIIRARLAAEMHASKFDPQTAETPGLHFAILRTRPDPNKKFYGGGMSTAIYNPPVQDYFQSSYSRMKIKNGVDYIEAGWTVNPSIYNDNQTRTYIYTTAGRSQCFNLFCSGFVQVSSAIPIGNVYSAVSTRGKQGTKYSHTIKIQRDGTSGNWYLKFGNDDTVIGYWDSRVFTAGLNNFATYIDWGGQVYGPPTLPSPAMGTGFKLSEDSTDDAYIRQITVADETHFMDVEDVEKHIDVLTDAYRVFDGGNYGDEFRYFMLYGGPGGYTGY